VRDECRNCKFLSATIVKGLDGGLKCMCLNYDSPFFNQYQSDGNSCYAHEGGSPIDIDALPPKWRAATLEERGGGVTGALEEYNLTGAEKLVLAFLWTGGGEDGTHYSFAAISAGTGLSRDDVRECCRSLAGKGLAVFSRGLWRWDGSGPAGAGYAAKTALPRGLRQEIDAITDAIISLDLIDVED